MFLFSSTLFSPPLNVYRTLIVVVMRLLTHNGLTSPLPPHTFPLRIVATSLELIPSTGNDGLTRGGGSNTHTGDQTHRRGDARNDMRDACFVSKLVVDGRLDYDALLQAFEDIKPLLTSVELENLTLPQTLPMKVRKIIQL